jgi:hypothetical protein
VGSNRAATWANIWKIWEKRGAKNGVSCRSLRSLEYLSKVSRLLDAEEVKDSNALSPTYYE